MVIWKSGQTTKLILDSAFSEFLMSSAIVSHENILHLFKYLRIVLSMFALTIILLIFSV